MFNNHCNRINLGSFIGTFLNALAPRRECCDDMDFFPNSAFQDSPFINYENPMPYGYSSRMSMGNPNIFEYDSPAGMSYGGDVYPSSSFVTNNFSVDYNKFMCKMDWPSLTSYMSNPFSRAGLSGANDMMTSSFLAQNQPFSFRSCDHRVLAQRFNSSFRGNLTGRGELIVSTAERYGIDPALFASILALESGYGSSHAGYEYNNFGGLMDPSTGCMSIKRFSSVEEGLDAVASNLQRNYINQGLTTPASIGRKYCPPGAANDLRGTNGNWAVEVTGIYQRFTV